MVPSDPPPIETVKDRHWFGSYGRIGFFADPDGARGTQRQIVAFGPRLIEDNYLELDFGYIPYRGKEAQVRALITVSFFDQLFHYDGKADAKIGLRQAYVEAEKLWGTGAFAWVGSRWVRGNDIYLLNFWPMDELNVVGFGGGWRDGSTDLMLTFALNRLENGLQVQRVPVPSNGYGAQEAELLDRQKRLIAAMAEKRYGGHDGQLGLKVRLYSELHHLPSGKRYYGDSYTEFEPLPDDLGFVAGVQFGAWNMPGPGGHLNLWLRYAQGLAVYDELGTPFGLNKDRRAVDAQEFRLALAGNLELKDAAVSLQYGGYARIFKDADVNEEDFDDRQEYAFAVRPQLNLGIFTPAVEASVQLSRPNGLNPRTNQQQVAQVTQLAVIPALTFGDLIGSYTRPQLRFIYAVSLLNQAAMDYYPIDDPRSAQDLAHYIGVNAEWWFGRGGGY
ncbi:MAG: carbohydrate porin [Myxococcales bacterium]|nr:carbohydrate porin [Myxococcales bacterium]